MRAWVAIGNTLSGVSCYLGKYQFKGYDQMKLNLWKEPTIAYGDILLAGPRWDVPWDKLPKCSLPHFVTFSINIFRKLQTLRNYRHLLHGIYITMQKRCLCLSFDTECENPQKLDPCPNYPSPQILVFNCPHQSLNKRNYSYVSYPLKPPRFHSNWLYAPILSSL